MPSGVDDPLTQIALAASLLAFFMAGYCLWQNVVFSRLRKSFFAGSKGINLENVILSLDMELKTSQQQQMFLEQSLKELKYNFAFATQKIGLVRFDPFDDGAGNFSFCLALLDATDNGVIITSMHGRQQNRIYSKRIINGQSEARLTEEEQQAIARANSKFENPNPKQKIQNR